MRAMVLTKRSSPCDFEVPQMMFGFGDEKEPLQETVDAVESIGGWRAIGWFRRGNDSRDSLESRAAFPTLTHFLSLSPTRRGAQSSREWPRWLLDA